MSASIYSTSLNTISLWKHIRMRGCSHRGEATHRRSSEVKPANVSGVRTWSGKPLNNLKERVRDWALTPLELLTVL